MKQNQSTRVIVSVGIGLQCVLMLFPSVAHGKKPKKSKPSKGGSAVKTALSMTYDGSDPEFWNVYRIGDPFLHPSVRVQPLKAGKDAAAFAVDIVANAGYDDRMGVAALAPGAPWAQELTTDYARVRAKLRGLTKYAGSDLGVGIQAARVELQSDRARDNASKVIVLFADGQSDTASALAEAQLAADAGMTIHCIGLGTGVDRALLDGIAAISGGSAIYIDNSTDPAVYEPQLQAAFQSIASNAVGIGLIR